VATARSKALGRERELDAIDQFVRGVNHWPDALLIEGPAGIGKTTMWRSGVHSATEMGHRVLSSRSVEAEARMSFTTLGDLLTESVGELADDLPEPQRQALDVALLRDKGGRVRPDRRAVSLATFAALRSLAGSNPVLIAIDDVQWIDPASARVLSFALRRLGDERVGILASLRVPGRADPIDLRTAMPSRLSVEVGPVEPTVLGRILRERLGAEFPHTLVARIHIECEGNPLFAIEIGRALLQHGGFPGPEQPLPVPEDLRGLLKARLRSLPRTTREVLLTTAAAVRPSIPVVLAATDPLATTHILSTAVEAGVIEIERDQIRFTHPLLAATIYADASEQQRRRTHARLAHVVADPEERVRHRAMASARTDADVAHALVRAAEAASSRGAPDSAADLQELAVKLTPQSDQHVTHSRSVRAAWYRYAAGDVRTARDRLEWLIASSPAGPERAALLYELSRMLWTNVRVIRSLLEQAAREPGELAAAALAAKIQCDIGWVAAFGGDLTQAARHGRQALAIAEASEDQSSAAKVLAFLGYVEFLLGRADRRTLERGVSLERALGPQLRQDSSARALGATLMWAGALDDARVQLERDYRETMRLGSITYPDYWEGFWYLTELELRAGNWDSASRFAAEGWDCMVETGLEEVREVHLWSTGLVAAHRGEVEIARARATEGLALAEAHGNFLHVVANRALLGFLEVSLGNHAAADEWMGPLVELVERSGMREPDVFPFLPNEIEALVSLGELHAAEELLERFAESGKALDRPCALAAAARCRGMLESASGELDRAAASIEVALVHHERARQPFDRARTLLVGGQILRRLKKKAAARGSLEQAFETFQALGASVWSERARRELGRIGGRPPSPTQLTETERRVAELVAEGKTNAEVAAQLFMSINTVRSNLRQIFRKSGVRSRSELAAIRGLVTDVADPVRGD
jgi:DNA-binding CsgD family transcriptional regulator